MSNSLSPTSYDQFVSHLDALVVFLALERDEVFTMLEDHVAAWFPEPQGPYLPGDVEHYRVQVCHSAFLLGYSYWEAFLADMARQVYRRYPGKLSADKEVKCGDLVRAITAGDDVLTMLVEREIRRVFAGSLKEVLAHFQQRLDLPLSNEQTDQLVRGSLIRNCLLHNGACADRLLAAASQYQDGKPIRLRSKEVNAFGLVVRDVAQALWCTAEKKGFIGAGNGGT